jgi:hypothetical protein
LRKQTGDQLEQYTLRQGELDQLADSRDMDDDSLNFGSDAAGATPGSILAQPPLQGEGTPGEGSSGHGDSTNPSLPLRK